MRAVIVAVAATVDHRMAADKVGHKIQQQSQHPQIRDDPVSIDWIVLHYLNNFNPMNCLFFRQSKTQTNQQLPLTLTPPSLFLLILL